MTFLRVLKKWMLFVSLTLCLIGYFLITKGQESIDIGLKILSYVLMFAGVFEIITYFVLKIRKRYKRNDFVIGLIVLILGITLLIFKAKVVTVTEMFLGLLMFISAIYKIQDSMDCKRIKNSHLSIYLTLTIICIACGVLVILKPFSNETFYIVAGCGLIFSGVTDFISTIYLAIIGTIALKQLEKEEQKNIKQEDDKTSEENNDAVRMTRIDL